MANIKPQVFRAAFPCFLFFLIVSSSAFGFERIGNRKVKVWIVRHNWYTASEICRADGMQLFSVHNEVEFNQSRALIIKYKLTKLWLAASDLGHEGDFVWATTGRRIHYAKWSPGQPDNYSGGEHCLEHWVIPSGHGWNDNACYVQNEFICEEIPTVPAQGLTLNGTCVEGKHSEVLTCSFRST